MTKVLILIVAAVLSTASGAVFAQTQSAAPPPARSVDFKSMTPEALDAFVNQSFARTDRNGDGFIDASEAPSKRVTETKNGQTISDVAGKDLWIADYDKDKDGKVSPEEYRTFTINLIKRVSR